jgi:hypothetical protein
MVTKVHKIPNKRGHIKIEFQDTTTKYLKEQIDMHRQLSGTTISKTPPATPESVGKLSDSSTGIDSVLKTQIKELEEKMNVATKNFENNFGPRLDNMEQSLPSTIATAVEKSFERMMQKSNESINML